MPLFALRCFARGGNRTTLSKFGCAAPAVVLVERHRSRPDLVNSSL